MNLGNSDVARLGRKQAMPATKLSVSATNFVQKRQKIECFGTLVFLLQQGSIVISRL